MIFKSMLGGSELLGLDCCMAGKHEVGCKLQALGVTFSNALSGYARSRA